MADTQAKVAPGGRARRILQRILWFLLVAAVAGTVVGYVTRVSNAVPGPAGFGRGVLHGALMPAAMPNLIIGRDVTIYAIPNTGIGYKLGYTMGVNGCGAVFFGIFFWRLNRWRKRMKAAEAERGAG